MYWNSVLSVGCQGNCNVYAYLSYSCSPYYAPLFSSQCKSFMHRAQLTCWRAGWEVYADLFSPHYMLMLLMCLLGDIENRTIELCQVMNVLFYIFSVEMLIVQDVLKSQDLCSKAFIELSLNQNEHLSMWMGMNHKNADQFMFHGDPTAQQFCGPWVPRLVICGSSVAQKQVSCGSSLFPWLSSFPGFLWLS